VKAVGVEEGEEEEEEDEDEDGTGRDADAAPHLSLQLSQLLPLNIFPI